MHLVIHNRVLFYCPSNIEIKRVILSRIPPRIRKDIESLIIKGQRLNLLFLDFSESTNIPIFDISNLPLVTAPPDNQGRVQRMPSGAGNFVW